MASIMNIKGTSQTNFFVGGPYLGFNLNTSALTLNTIWNIPNNQTGYLKNDGSGNLSWASSTTASPSGVFVGNFSGGGFSDPISFASISMGNLSDFPYSEITIGTFT